MTRPRRVPNLPRDPLHRGSLSTARPTWSASDRRRSRPGHAIGRPSRRPPASGSSPRRPPLRPPPSSRLRPIPRLLVFFAPPERRDRQGPVPSSIRPLLRSPLGRPASVRPAPPSRPRDAGLSPSPRTPPYVIDRRIRPRRASAGRGAGRSRDRVALLAIGVSIGHAGRAWREPKPGLTVAAGRCVAQPPRVRSISQALLPDRRRGGVPSPIRAADRIRRAGRAEPAARLDPASRRPRPVTPDPANPSPFLASAQLAPGQRGEPSAPSPLRSPIRCAKLTSAPHRDRHPSLCQFFAQRRSAYRPAMSPGECSSTRSRDDCLRAVADLRCDWPAKSVIDWLMLPNRSTPARGLRLPDATAGV